MIRCIPWSLILLMSLLFLSDLSLLCNLSFLSYLSHLCSLCYVSIVVHLFYLCDLWFLYNSSFLCVIPFFNVLACFLGKVILFQDSEQSLWSSQMMKKLRSSRLPDDEVDSLLVMNIACEFSFYLSYLFYLVHFNNVLKLYVTYLTYYMYIYFSSLILLRLLTIILSLAGWGRTWQITRKYLKLAQAFSTSLTAISGTCHLQVSDSASTSRTRLTANRRGWLDAVSCQPAIAVGP